MNAETPVRPARARRGPHADRTATMRQRLIDAAVACLCRVGYAATTTQLVMDEAGVSRGAMLHHFPTKVDLMIAVSEYAAKAQDERVATTLQNVPQGMELFIALTDATWEAMCEPPALALIEIMIASRSDPALGERFPEVERRLEEGQKEGVWEQAQLLGIRDRGAIERMFRLHRAAMRGLAIEMTFTGERAPSNDAMELLNWYKRSLTGTLLTGRQDLFPENETQE